MSNEFVTASANFISESYSRENAGNIDFQEENTAYLVGIYEATKELLTDLIAEAEETDDEIAEEIADELIFNEEIFDYIDSLIDDEFLSEDVYIVPFSSFSVYLEETTEKCYDNILTEGYLEEGIAGLLAKGAGALFKGLRGVQRAGGFRGVTAAGAKSAQSAIGSGLQSAGKAIQSGATRAATKAYIGAAKTKQAAQQGVEALKAAPGAIQRGAIRGAGMGAGLVARGAESAKNVAGGIRRAGMETLGKLRQFGAEKIKQGQQLASNIKQGIGQKVGEVRKGMEVRQRAKNIQNIRNQAAQQRQSEIQSRARNIQNIRAQKAQEVENRAKEVRRRAGNIQNIRRGKEVRAEFEKGYQATRNIGKKGE